MCRVSIAQGQPLRDVHSATATMREAAHDLTVAAALSKLARPRCSEPPSWCPLLPVQWGGRGGAMCRVSIAQGQPVRDVHKLCISCAQEPKSCRAPLWTGNFGWPLS